MQAMSKKSASFAAKFSKPTKSTINAMFDDDD